MMAQLVKDMTQGKVTPLLIKFMMPMLLGNLFQQLYNIADSAIVGQHEGANALGAIGCTGSLTFLFFSFCNGLASGAGIIVAQHFGAGNEKEVKKTLANSFYIVVLSGVLLSVLGLVLARPILELLQTPQVQLQDAVDYMHIICGGTIAVAVYNYAAQTMRALGDSKTPLIFLIIATVINIALDILFVVCLGMGVKGAAWATIIAQSIAAVASLFYGVAKNPYFQLKREHLRLDYQIFVLCFQVGMPLGVQSMLIAVSCVVLQRFVNAFDEAVVSAFTVTSRVEQLVQQPFNSLGMAIANFTGQNMGAGKSKRVRTALKKSAWIVAGISVTMLLVCYLGGNLVVSCFVKEAEVIAIGTTGLKITSLMFFPLGLIYITRGLLNGANDTFYAMINGAIEVCGRIGFSFLLVTFFSIGLWSVWLATGLTWTITGIAGLIRYRQGKWLEMTITNQTAEGKQAADKILKASEGEIEG
ncbi:MAG: MATE family efflux transporter [Lachnospiraceae bacterium]|nr:MATE family efflux transporter [Lachnospiraceae bacterium]